MPTVVLKLFAGQGTGRTDKAATICFPFGKHKNTSEMLYIVAVLTKPHVGKRAEMFISLSLRAALAFVSAKILDFLTSRRHKTRIVFLTLSQ